MFALASVLALTTLMQPQNQTVHKGMETPWTQDALSATTPWPEYPRPQMEREDWMNLNGTWEFAIADKGATAWPGKQNDIKVPYPPQSMLSGVNKFISADQEAWYRRTFTLPSDWNGKRTILHFGAVDWDATVWVNGKEVVRHKGGYTPFHADITEALKSGENDVVLRAWDGASDNDQPVGKQTFRPSGIWYTNVSGIWQTVWLEPVAATSIASVKPVATNDGAVTVAMKYHGASKAQSVRLTVSYKGRQVAAVTTTSVDAPSIQVNEPQLWSPDTPNLYDLKIELMQGTTVVDSVESYFAFREIELKKDEYGDRVYLNGEPVFMFGPLDQGWWPDGLYAPPTDEGMRYDLEWTKKAGFNTVRKHVKVEPARWYRHCDEIGLLVWQDMPNSHTAYPGWDQDHSKWNPKPDGERTPESKAEFRRELTEMIDVFGFFPSVVVWVPFNEAWGQHATADTSEYIRSLDSHRLINPASGGNFVKTGDMLDIHAYPGPSAPRRVDGMAIVLGEFGGLGLPVAGHTWQDEENWGYRTFTDKDELAVRYKELIDTLVLLKQTGLSGAIYTQTTDVEIEVNGYLTYDRKYEKLPAETLAEWHKPLYGPVVTVKSLDPTAEERAATWQYTTSEPSGDWWAEQFDTSSWRSGKGGFGTETTPNAHIGTVWDTDAIWLRREFTLGDVPEDTYLKLHHDEDVKVYLNGKLIFEATGYTVTYVYKKIDPSLLRKGKNVLAVSCKQTRGGQYIDVGFAYAVRD